MAMALKEWESPNISARKDVSWPKLELLTRKNKSDTLAINKTMAIRK
jgi:hypothetical protein